MMDLSPIKQIINHRKVLSTFPTSLSKESRKKTSNKDKNGVLRPKSLYNDYSNLLTSDESCNSTKNKNLMAGKILDEPILISDDDTEGLLNQPDRFFSNYNNNDAKNKIDDPIIVISDSEESQKYNGKENSDSLNFIESSVHEILTPSISRKIRRINNNPPNSSHTKFSKLNEIPKKKISLPENRSNKKEINYKHIKTPLSESKTNFIEDWLKGHQLLNSSDSDTFSNKKSSTLSKVTQTSSKKCRKKLDLKASNENIIDSIVINSDDESLGGFQSFANNIHCLLESTRKECTNGDFFSPNDYRIRRLSFSSESEDDLLKSPIKSPKKTPKPKTVKTAKNKDTPGTPNLADISLMDKKTINSFSDSKPNEQAIYYIKNYNKKRQELALKLFKLFNRYVFEDKLPPIKIEWSNRMQSTAGYCYNKREYRNNKIARISRIKLSTKVVNNPARLRDTLLHEMCHAASWIISEVRDGHGHIWKSWASLAGRAFPEIPPVTTCHSYTIETKYTYRCTNCGYSFGRQSKSVNVERKRCGKCYGFLEILLNSKENKLASDNTAKTVFRKPKPPSGFALFVKENYKVVKQTTPGLKHGDIMRELSQKFAKVQLGNR